MENFLCQKKRKSNIDLSGEGQPKEPKAYFRCRAEVRHAEIISAWLGATWHASVLDEESIAVLKQLYWCYLIKDNFKVKENINHNLDY